MLYSWDEALSWNELRFSNKPTEIENIVIEPQATSQVFVMYGSRGDLGMIYQLDFRSMHEQPCKGVENARGLRGKIVDVYASCEIDPACCCNELATDATITVLLDVPGWSSVADDWGVAPYRVSLLQPACVSAGKWWRLRDGNWSSVEFERGLVYDRTHVYDAGEDGTRWATRLPRAPLGLSLIHI